MTKDELEREANRIIRSAKQELENTEGCNARWLLHIDNQWKTFAVPPDCGNIMNNGEAKDVIFAYIRGVVATEKADAVLFVSDMWQARTTPEGEKHIDTPEWKKHNTHGFGELMKLGWVMREEALLVTAQTAEDALIISQPYRRIGRRIQLLTAHRGWSGQAHFKGRAKMYGDLREENLI